MPRIIQLALTAAVYTLGSGAFVYIFEQVLERLLDMRGTQPWLISIPLGTIAFAVFIWINWDSHFEGWSRKRWPRNDKD